MLICVLKRWQLYTLYTIKKNMNEHMLSPASGKIIRIGEESRTITIFMYLHNVHITTAPLDGVVKKITPENGLFQPAFFRSADFNTRNTIELSTKYGDVTIVQIAGFFTRKIICEVEEGQGIMKGERIGKICLGSRVDISIPSGFEILVKEGAHVKCRKTIMASSK